MPNADLAARIRKEILERPEHHDQEFYLDGVDVLTPDDNLSDGDRPECGTVLCVAGWAAHLTGCTLTSYARGVIASKPVGGSRPVFDAAQTELGLSEVDATWLFSGLRSREEVLAALGQLADGTDHINPVTASL